MNSKLPKIGKTYDCYDDGKIRSSRRYDVEIKEIIPFESASDELLEEWKNAIADSDWLFAKETDYFIIADCYEQGINNITTSIFVRTIDGEWFSIGDFWNSGLLVVE